jgi:hypothetical protein
MYGLAATPAELPSTPYVASKHGEPAHFSQTQMLIVLIGIIGLTKAVN